MNRVLIVDDSRISRRRLRGLLERDGVVAVDEAGDAQGVAGLRDRAWDVVFCDLLLPDRDGFALLAELKRELPEAHLVVYSANAMPDTQELARGMGADYLPKPATLDDVRALRERWQQAA